MSKFKPGRTIPYSPIEALGNDQNGDQYSEASDIYSIGAIISELLFDKKLIEFKKSSQNKIVSKLINKTHKLLYSDIVVKEFAVKYIMKILKVLMLKCVNPDPE